jgi:CRP-like cAMP-binding protein
MIPPYLYVILYQILLEIIGHLSERVGEMEIINNKSKIKEYIKKFDLDGVIRDTYFNKIELHKYKRRDIIYYMKDDLKYLYFLVEGKIIVHLQTIDGKEMYLDFGKPLEILGDVEYISSSGIYSNVEAITDCYLLALPMEVVDKNAKENWKFYEIISKFLANKLTKTSKKYTEMILYPLKNRLATYLYEISTEEVLINPFRQEEVALSYGISDRHLRRILLELEEEGIIEKNRKSINVIDRKLLEKYIIDSK